MLTHLNLMETKAMKNTKMIEPNSDWKLYEEYAEKWSPYKSIASLHFWKTVD